MNENQRLMDIPEEVRDKLSKIVREVLTKQIQDLRIHEIDIKPDLDQFDDPILRISIVYSLHEPSSKLSGVSEVLRSLRPKFGEMQEERFPILSFIAEAELAKNGVTAH